MQSAVFLDRDGVLNNVVLRNGEIGSPRALDEFKLLPGVGPAVAGLKRAGLLVVVVTNQPDLARGFLTPAELERMHERLRGMVAVDAIYTCWHDEEDGCGCRKPKPGLLFRAAQEWGISLKKSWLVGDGWKDIEAGKAAECRTVLLRNPDRDPAGIAPDLVLPDLPKVVGVILEELECR